MKSNSITIFILFLLFTLACNNSKNSDQADVRIVPDEAEKKADIMIDGKLFTSFRWPENVYKPVLYPVITSSGTEITRGFPLKPRQGEQVDHIHQVGIWLNYGNVNGLDFWGNGHRGEKEPNGGEIKHLSIDRVQSKNGEATLVASSNWLAPDGSVLLKEKTEFHFQARGTLRIIDRISTLTAQDSDVVFKDTKEGMFGIRVARQLEMPSKSGVILIDSAGNPSKTRDTLNLGVTGDYLSSEGLQGEAVWGTRSDWMNLSGVIGDEKISVAVCDHPENPGYPTYWHARGYGLFAANPLGWKDFTKGKEEFNFTIPAKKTEKFRYRVVISSNVHLTPGELDALAVEFGKEYK